MDNDIMDMRARRKEGTPRVEVRRHNTTNYILYLHHSLAVPAKVLPPYLRFPGPTSHILFLRALPLTRLEPHHQLPPSMALYTL